MPTKTIHDANQINTPAVGDEFPIWQVSSSAQKRITVADVVAYLESALDLSDDYLLRDGSVAMLAALDMGGFAITNVGNVDGVDVSALSTAHTALSAAHTTLDGVALKKDGSVALTGDWDIGASRKIQAERIEARSNAGLKLYEDGGKGIYIEDSTGYVALGTVTDPAYMLDIAGSVDTLLRVLGTSGAYPNIALGEDATHLLNITWDSPNDEALFQTYSRLYPVAFDASYIRFLTNSGNERMRILSNGTMGYGITSPDSLVHIHQSSAGSVAASSGSVLTIEQNAETAIQILTPNNVFQSIYFGDVDDADIGAIRYYHVQDSLFFNTNAANRMVINSAGRVEPGADGTQDFGSPSRRWKDIYATNATIQTSDERDKVNVQPSDLGLDFIRALNPVSWVWADRDEAQITETKTVKRQKRQKVMRIETVIETAGNGKRVRKTIEREVDELVFELIPLFHPNGKPFMEEKRTTVIDSETGEPVEVVERVQAVEQVPVYEEVEVDEVVRQPVKLAHRRPHYGLVAQQVKRAMDTVGVSDFAGYIYNEESDAYGLRYNEFTAPIIAAIQQLADRMDLAGI